MTKLTLYTSNDQVITLSGVTDSGGTPLIDATINGSILDKNRVAVPNGAVYFRSDTTDPGTYYGTITAAFNPVLGSGYILSLLGTHLGNTFLIEVACKVAKRTI